MNAIILSDLTNNSLLKDCSAEADKIVGGLLDINVAITTITANTKTLTNTIFIGGNTSGQAITQIVNG
jgi:hypothetical protein